MSRRKRRSFTPEFKARVVRDALKEREPLSQLASRYELSAAQISAWKKQALDALPEAFAKGGQGAAEDHEQLVKSLYEEIGRLKMEHDWLKKI